MRICFLITAFLWTLLAIGQVEKGTIVYEEKFDIHRTLRPDMEDFKERIPQFRTTKKALYFDRGKATYIRLKEQDTSVDSERDGRRMRMRFGGGDQNNVYYTNIVDGSFIDSRELFGKQFLIVGTRDTLNWKITGKQKQVGDYLCQEAIIKDSLSQTSAWFTPMIPISSGPDNYSGLPGMILHVDVDNGAITITALEISLNKLEEGKIQKPEKGKKVTEEEFRKLRREKMEEMRKENGGRRFMIHRRR